MIKEYEINDCVFVINKVLNSMYQNYYGSIPKPIENKILALIAETEDLLDFSKNESDNFDIEEMILVQRVKYYER